MLLRLYTESFFKAAHKLENYDGICSRIHGHTWKISIWVEGEEKLLNKTGILWDFNKLDVITKEFDHNYLNEKIKSNPTAENISLYIYKYLKELDPDLMFKVRIYEDVVDKKSYCELGDF